MATTLTTATSTTTGYNVRTVERPRIVINKPSQLAVYKNKSSSKLIISCKAPNSGNNSNDQNELLLNNTKKVDRRNMLLGLGGLYGLTLGSGASNTVAAPLVVDVESGSIPTNNDMKVFGEAPGQSNQMCDLNFPRVGIKDFRFSDYSFNTMKIRREAHWVSSNDTSYVEDYKRALQIMKSLPASDPRSFEGQRKIHCAYCDGAYRQLGFPNRNFRIHYSWLFAPFHRWYLYFFERILASLINKPDFALPYWSWDNPKSMTIPPMFLMDRNSPLYNDTRKKEHVNFVVDLDYARRFGEPLLRDEVVVEQNLEILRKSMGEMNRGLFFGGKYQAGDVKAAQFQAGKQDENFGGGKLEDALHNGVHAWVDGDMGYYSTGGKDPLFYAHHANIDRMWSIWKTLGGGRRDLDDPDYLGASFVFWDEFAQPVRVYVRDCLDTKKLGFDYECNYLPWNDSFPSDCQNVWSQGGGGGWGHGGGGWGHGGGGGGDWEGHGGGGWGNGGGGGGDWGGHGGGGWGHGGGDWGSHNGGGGWGHGGGGDWGSGGGGGWGHGGGGDWGSGGGGGWGHGGGGGDWGSGGGGDWGSGGGGGWGGHGGGGGGWGGHGGGGWGGGW